VKLALFVKQRFKYSIMRRIFGGCALLTRRLLLIIFTSILIVAALSTIVLRLGIIGRYAEISPTIALPPESTPSRHVAEYRSPPCGYSCIYEPSHASNLLYLSKIAPVRVDAVINEVFETSGFNPRTITACMPSGSYSKALLQVNVSIGGGSQYDRVLWVFINGVPAFWGSTSQLSTTVVEADITHLLSILRGCVNISIILSNWIVPQMGLTGVYRVNISILLFPGNPDTHIPDFIIPLWSNGQISWATLNPANSSTSQTVKLPRNVSRVLMMLYIKGSRSDEFFYMLNRTIRDVLIYVDGRLVGVAHLFPTIYAGGFNPYYWAGITATNALSQRPELIDITALVLPAVAADKEVEIRIEIPGLKEFGGDSRIDLSGAILAWFGPEVSSARLLKARSNYTASYEPGHNSSVEKSSYSIEYETFVSFVDGRSGIARLSAAGGSYSFQAIDGIRVYIHVQSSERDARLTIDGSSIWSSASRCRYEIYISRNITASVGGELETRLYSDNIRVVGAYYYSDPGIYVECFDSTAAAGSYSVRMRGSGIISLGDFAGYTARQAFCGSNFGGFNMWVEAFDVHGSGSRALKSYSLVFWLSSG